MKLAAVLLAGGRSTRMGQDKAWLDCGGRPLWQIQRDKLLALNPTQFFISCRLDQGFETSGNALLIDPPATSSPLEALVNCLRFVRTPMLVMAVDLPGMKTPVLELLAFQHDKATRGVVFELDARFEPLCAVYTPAILPLLENAVAHRRLSLQDVIRSGIEHDFMDALTLPAEFASAFTNTNTPEEWTQAQPKA